MIVFKQKVTTAEQSNEENKELGTKFTRHTKSNMNKNVFVSFMITHDIFMFWSKTK